MAIGWFIAPYKTKNTISRDIRYCAMDDFTPDIFGVDGDWSEIEIDGDKAIVIVRATDSIINKISHGSDVAITKIDDPKLHWKPTRISTINGSIINCGTISDLTKYLLDDQQWGDLKAFAETLALRSESEGYIKIDKSDWRITVQLLVLLGKAGYGLNKISTGTFPTTGILDTFDRANATTLGANWSLLHDWNSWVVDWGITGNLCYNPDTGGYCEQYYNVSTFGPDSEVYVTLSTITPQGTADGTGLDLRAQQPGANYDGYTLYCNHQPNPNTWRIDTVTNAVSTTLGAAVDRAMANGYKMGFEIIGSVLTGYIDTGGGWSTVLTRTDTGNLYPNAGYLGGYGTGLEITWRWNDFGGGTVVAAGGGGCVKQASSSTGRRRKKQQTGSGLIIV